MDGQVLFILILIFLSIVEGLSRSRRQKQRREQQPEGELPPPQGWPEPGRIPDGREGARRPVDPASPQPTEARQTAEDMVPRDLWQEIEALVRGEAPPRPPQPSPPPAPTEVPTGGPTPAPQRLPTAPRRDATEVAPRPRGARPVPARRREAPEARPRTFDRPTEPLVPALEERAPDQGRVPKSRVEAATAPPLPAPATIRRSSGPKVRIRGQAALRDAFVVREIVGRPLALRDPDDENFWTA